MAAGAAGGKSADTQLKARGQTWSRRTSLWGLQQAAAERSGNLFIRTPSGGQGPSLCPLPHLGRLSAHLRRTPRTPQRAVRPPWVAHSPLSAALELARRALGRRAARPPPVVAEAGPRRG